MILYNFLRYKYLVISAYIETKVLAFGPVMSHDAMSQ